MASRSKSQSERYCLGAPEYQKTWTIAVAMGTEYVPDGLSWQSQKHGPCALLIQATDFALNSVPGVP